MTKKIDEETRKAIRQDVEAGEMAKKDIAAKYGVHPTMISKIVPAKAVKAPKRRFAKKNNGSQSKNGTKARRTYTEEDWLGAFDEWLRLRVAQEEAKIKVIEIAKTLK